MKNKEKNQRFFCPSIFPKSRKAQLKIQQMAFMLIAITVFFALVGIFVLSFKLSSIRETANILEEKNALLLVSKLSNSPEFSCGQVFGTPKLNCVDADKAMVLKDKIPRYEGFWGVSSMEIRKIYPKINSEVECNRGNYPECNIIKFVDSNTENTEGVFVGNFVTLCRKTLSSSGNSEDKCEIAKLMVSYVEKGNE